MKQQGIEGVRVKRAAEPRVEDKFRAKIELLARHPEILNTHHRVFLGDAREMIELSEPGSVHLVVTSPPYWTLKAYDGGAGKRQLGHWKDYLTFQVEIAKVWRRCYDLLVPGGRLCVVVGDV